MGGNIGLIRILPGGEAHTCVRWATAEVLRTCRATLWAKHGVVAIGETMSQALDWIEILEKAAPIDWLVASGGQQPVGLTDQQIEAMLQTYGFT